MVLLASSTRGYVAAAIFGTSMLVLFTSSASYHVLPWRPRARRWMKRVDHSAIFVLIAGTITPFCLLAMDNAWGISMLSVAWTLAGLGVLMKVAWIGAPHWLCIGAYLGLGWMPVVSGWETASHLPAWMILGMIGGGLIYTIGAVVYATKRPNPFPRVFGYHEVFHTLVLAGCGVFYALVATTV
jgi:hemolysin III